MTPTRLLALLLAGAALLLGTATVEASSGWSSGGDCAEVSNDPYVDPEECLSSGGDASAMSVLA